MTTAVERLMRREGDTLRYSLVSQGIEGIEWAYFLPSKMRIEPWTKAVLQHEKFAVTPEGVATDVTVLPIADLGLAQTVAARKRLGTLKADVACQTAVTLTVAEMLAIDIDRIVFVSEVLLDDLGDQCLLQLSLEGLHAVRLKSHVGPAGFGSRTAFAYATPAQ